MRRDLGSAVRAVVILTVLLGLLYPLAVTGIAQVAFPDRADGSRIERGSELVGSRLIGQDFKRDPRYFQGRPSATGYSADATAFNNLGPNSQELSDQFAANAKAYLALEGPANPGLTLAGIPGDAVQTSASGVDPQISEANAAIQTRRVARQRGGDLARVRALVAEHTDGRSLGLFGQPGVRVLELNLALDSELPAR